jgi:hypothetical protein
MMADGWICSAAYAAAISEQNSAVSFATLSVMSAAHLSLLLEVVHKCFRAIDVVSCDEHADITRAQDRTAHRKALDERRDPTSFKQRLHEQTVGVVAEIHCNVIFVQFSITSRQVR